MPGLLRCAGEQRGVADAIGKPLQDDNKQRGIWEARKEEKVVSVSNVLPCILPKIRDLVSLLLGDEQ